MKCKQPRPALELWLSNPFSTEITITPETPIYKNEFIIARFILQNYWSAYNCNLLFRHFMSVFMEWGCNEFSEECNIYKPSGVFNIVGIGPLESIEYFWIEFYVTLFTMRVCIILPQKTKISQSRNIANINEHQWSAKKSLLHLWKQTLVFPVVFAYSNWTHLFKKAGKATLMNSRRDTNFLRSNKAALCFR